MVEESGGGRSVVEAEMVQQYSALKAEGRLRACCAALIATTLSGIDTENYQAVAGPPYTSRLLKVAVWSVRRDFVV